MSEFDDYLAAIRSALDLSPKRAGEICDEVRTHLEGDATQLQQGGLSRDEAAAAAISAFGDPTEMARRLGEANRRHRAVGVFRPVVAFALSLGGMIMAFALLEGDFAAFRFLKGHRWDSFIWEQLALLMGVMVMGPAALLAGMIAGRRWWWLAGLPLTLVGVPFLMTEGAAYFIAIEILAPLATLGWGGCVLAFVKALRVGIRYGLAVPEVIVTLRAIVVVASILAVLLAVAAFTLWRRTRGSLPTEPASSY